MIIIFHGLIIRDDGFSASFIIKNTAAVIAVIPSGAGDQ
jgi:hypothetical protein